MKSFRKVPIDESLKDERRKPLTYVSLSPILLTILSDKYLHNCLNQRIITMPRNTTLRLSEDIVKQGKILAAVQGVSLSSLIRQMIYDSFQQFEKERLEQNRPY